jgi:hypothetical protein
VSTLLQPSICPPSQPPLPALLLKMTGLKVTSIKIDPYMNIDAGTMRPQEHGAIKKEFLSLAILTSRFRR